jgi:hypothetical protein
VKRLKLDQVELPASAVESVEHDAGLQTGRWARGAFNQNLLNPVRMPGVLPSQVIPGHGASLCLYAAPDKRWPTPY